MERERENTAVTDSCPMAICDEQCERMVIGSVMNNAHSLEEARDRLTAECFSSPMLADIWSAVKSLDDRGDIPDLITVTAELSHMGKAVDVLRVMELSSLAAVGSISTHIGRLLDLSVRRRFWGIAQKLMLGACSEVTDVADIHSEVKEAVDGIFCDSTSQIVPISQAAKELLEHVARNMSGDSSLTGTYTGFREIDNRGGLQSSDLIVVAGETSHGKTALALTITANAMSRGAKIAVYSMEMTRKQLTARIVSGISGIPSSEMLHQRMSPDRFSHVAKAVDIVSDKAVFFDDASSSSLDKICASIRTMKLKENIDGVVVDYLQIITLNSRNSTREQVVAEAARRLKNLAKELDIWVMALSQLSRDRNYPQPTLNRLRDSGQIEEAADMVILVYRPEQSARSPGLPEPYEEYDTHGMAYLDVAKGRNSGTFSFLARFDGPTTRFIDCEPENLQRRTTPSVANNPDRPF